MKQTINSRQILYPPGGNDEAFTPAYAVAPLFEFLPKGKTIWCPFDDAGSNYSQMLKGNGWEVVHTHLSSGEDFMKYEPFCEWDMIISNPPFTKKRQIFERALSFGKPFALLMSLTWLNDAAPVEIFGEDLQLLMFDKRIKFNNQVQKGITYKCAYYCYKFLPKPIMVRKLNIPKKS